MACINKANPYLLKYPLKNLFFFNALKKGSPCYQHCTDSSSLNFLASNSLEIEWSLIPKNSIRKELTMSMFKNLSRQN